MYGNLYRDQPLQNMTQRQETQLFVLFSDIQHALYGLDLKQDITVRNHRTFGHAGGARGVNQHADIIWLAFGDFTAEALFSVCGVAQGIELIQKHHHGIAEIAQAVAFKHNHFAQARHPLTDRQILVQLFVIFHKQKC